MPVRMPLVRGHEGATGGQELEFIVRSLLELKLQVEELRHRFDAERGGAEAPVGWLGEFGGSGQGYVRGHAVAAIEPRGVEAPPNEVVIPAGTKMSEVERRVIEAALRETHGNRRKAAEMLGIGERTLYRKIKEYKLPEMDDLLEE